MNHLASAGVSILMTESLFMDRIKLVVLLGPTASGKSEMSLLLAKRLNADVISADSLQVYRYMDIGTAKPSAEIRREIPHHMIDIRFPDQSFNASDFRREAAAVIESRWKEGRPCLIVGGTGLYIKVLLGGLFRCPGSDQAIRAKYRNIAMMHGRRHLHRMLSRVDPEAASRIHPEDLFRVVRALEVFELTGRSISEHQAGHRFAQRPYEVLKLGLAVSREQLYRRIEQRVDEMIGRGLVEEVASLLERGYGEDIKPMKAIGYRHICEYLKGRIDLKDAVELIKRDTRRYAKRQMTWFKADQEIEWLEPKEKRKILEKVGQFMKNLR